MATNDENTREFPDAEVWERVREIKRGIRRTALRTVEIQIKRHDSYGHCKGDGCSQCARLHADAVKLMRD